MLTRKCLILAVMTAALSHGGTVYLEGTLGQGQTFSGATFSGWFDATFPIAATNQTLSNFDVAISDNGFTMDLNSNTPNTNGYLDGGDVVAKGALEVQFISSNVGFVGFSLYFDVPFTGNAPVLLETSQGFFSLLDTDFEVTDVASGLASTSPIPEPGSWLLTGVGVAWFVRRKG